MDPKILLLPHNFCICLKQNSMSAHNYSGDWNQLGVKNHIVQWLTKLQSKTNYKNRANKLIQLYPSCYKHAINDVLE